MMMRSLRTLTQKPRSLHQNNPKFLRQFYSTHHIPRDNDSQDSIATTKTQKHWKWREMSTGIGKLGFRNQNRMRTATSLRDDQMMEEDKLPNPVEIFDKIHTAFPELTSRLAHAHKLEEENASLKHRLAYTVWLEEENSHLRKALEQAEKGDKINQQEYEAKPNQRKEVNAHLRQAPADEGKRYVGEGAKYRQEVPRARNDLWWGLLCCAVGYLVLRILYSRDKSQYEIPDRTSSGMSNTHYQDLSTIKNESQPPKSTDVSKDMPGELAFLLFLLLGALFIFSVGVGSDKKEKKTK